MKSIYKIIITIFFLVTLQLFSQEAPYPASQIIENIVWYIDSIVSFGQGSDQWPMTWADDGSLYASWGDGWGWRESGSAKNKKSIGITQISGTPPDLKGVDLWGKGPGSDFGKPDALIAYDNKIFMFWTSGDSKYDHDSFTAVSLDSGKTWELSHKKLLRIAPSGFRVRGICQFGKGYQDAQDDYLYIYFGMNRHPDIYLARVKKEFIFNDLEYEWYHYRNYDGTASWTSDFNHKSIVFHDNNAYMWHISVCYIPKLDRFVLTKPHFTSGSNRETVYAAKAPITGFGVFDAPNPWGPWTTVQYQNIFFDDFMKFNYIIIPKFYNNSNNEVWMAWSGYPEYDNVTFIKGRFIMNAK